MQQSDQAKRWKFDLICAVPLHLRRYLARGYNQSALIAKGTAERLHRPYEQVVIRSRMTQQQAKLGAGEREKNVQGAFRAREAARGKRILLIDDVYTTGATIKSCAESLKRIGAKDVYLATVARTKPSARGWKS
ncbi:MAG: phosphoribosyltransferase family protein [Deinococcales bacterium]